MTKLSFLSKLYPLNNPVTHAFLKVKKYFQLVWDHKTECMIIIQDWNIIIQNLVLKL